MGGSAGVGEDFGLAGVETGFSADREGFGSCATEICASAETITATGISRRRNINATGKSRNQRLCSRANPQRKAGAKLLCGGPNLVADTILKPMRVHNPL